MIFTGSTESDPEFSLVYFPFLIMAMLFAVIAIGGECKDGRSATLSNILVFWAAIEFFAYPCLGIFAIRDHSASGLGAICFVAFIFLIAVNVLFVVYFKKVIEKDEMFQYWSGSYKRTTKALTIISAVVSFKVMRLLYSRLFGLDNFNAAFTRHDTLFRPMNGASVINFVFTVMLVIVVDVVGLALYSWGSQFYMTCIETLLLAVGIIVMTVVEFKTAKIHGYVELASKELEREEGAPDMEKRLREEVLKGIISTIKGTKNFFNTNRIEECINDDEALQRTYSLPCHLIPEEDEESQGRVHSYPLSPASRKALEANPFLQGIEKVPPTPDQLPDNVYVEAKPHDPLAGAGREFKDSLTQTFNIDAAKHLSGSEMRIANESDEKRRKKESKRRGKKNPYYNAIDEEDDAHYYGNESPTESELGIIPEEEEERRAKGNRRGRKGRKHLAGAMGTSGVTESEGEEGSEDEGPFFMPKEGKVGTFNEHDVLGEFDRDERNNIILLTNEKVRATPLTLLGRTHRSSGPQSQRERLHCGPTWPRKGKRHRKEALP